MNSSLTIVILAAGLGTRMKSRQAKVLHRAGGRTLIEHVLRTALELAPPERVFVVVGHQADKVREALSEYGVGFIEQREQKGTGHAVMVGRAALEQLGGYMLILYGDCPLIRAETLQGLVNAEAGSEAAGTNLTAFMDDPTGYGRVLRDAAGRVTGVVEQKAGTLEQLAIKEANMGLYCYRSEIFWKHVDEIQPNNPAREYYLTDMVEILVLAGYPMGTFTIRDPKEVLGINNRVELAQVDGLLRERKVRQLMLDGVTVEKPETVTIDADVVIGPDTIVEPFARILGRSRLGGNCRVGMASIISESELGDDVNVLPYTIINTSRVGSGSEIGPYARLRMENHLAPDSHIGNFVELKKTRFGAGSKAMHLSYLGDSTIGEDVNIGAGTITCNYDGIRKYGTRIGDGAFVGSHSTLVAPIEIGPGSYVGAGSVITDTVPADALALGRARQLVKEDWARKRRAKSDAEHGHT